MVLCVTCVLLIRWRLCAKHRHELARINAAADGGVDRFPPSHMSITDEDVARMPGTRAAAARRSLQDRNRRSLYTPMSSRETLESRPVLKGLERVKEINRNDRESTVPVWPLPRRCIRSDGSPLSKKTSTTPRKRKDGAWNSSPMTATDRLSRRSEEQHVRPPSLDIIQSKIEDEPSPNAEIRPPNRIVNSSSPNGDLKPPPLFHDKQRCNSHGNIFTRNQKKKNVAGIYLAKVQPRGTHSVPCGTRPVPCRTHVPRSMSVCSQDPGAAPTHLLPPLPFEIVSDQNQRVKSPTDFSGCGSLFSDNTSILDDEETKILSHAETDLTSLCLSSPFLSSSLSQSTPKGLSLWSNSELQERASPMSVSKSLDLRPQLSSQRSLRASIENSLPKSISNGLSMPLLDLASNTASNSDMNKRKSRADSKSNVGPPRKGGKKKAKRGNSPSFPLRNRTDFDIHEDSPNERLSMCILRPISGNEGSLNPCGQRPFSIATDNPFLWDPHTSMPPGKPRDRTSGRHHQDCVRITNVPISIDSQYPSRVEELKESSQDTVIKHTVVHRPNMTFRPPSRATFDVHYTPPGRLRNTQVAKISPPCARMLFKVNMYDEENEDPESAISTPTRKPSDKTPSGTHPDSAKSIFDNLPKSPWPLPEPASESTNSQESNILNPSIQHHEDPFPDMESRPSSYFFNFPDPPKRPFSPNWREPKTPIRGPRALPSLPPNLNNSPSRRGSRSSSYSPSRSPFRDVVKAYGDGRSKIDLRASILQLRRQNSEVNNHQSHGSREHERYLSISDDIFTDEGAENERGGIRGSKTVPFGDGASTPKRGSMGISIGTPSSFYDGKGFLREG